MSLKIKFLGHSAFMISSENANILIDPFISENPQAQSEIEKTKPTDILVTHAHADHLGDAIPLSKTYNAPITAIFELANYCMNKGANAQGVNLGGKVPFSWGYTNWLPATHSSSTPEGDYGGCAASVLVGLDGVKIYHAGDTGLHYDLKMVGDFYNPDIALLPIGGFFTMGIDEAVQAVKWLGCKTVIPMHYNTFPPIAVDANEFKQKVESETSAKCIILNMNQTAEF